MSLIETIIELFDSSVNPTMKRFSQKLYELRTFHQLTLQALASKLGYKAHGYVSEIESGKKLPTLEFVLAVAQLFNIKTDDLLNDNINLNLTTTQSVEHTLKRQSLAEHPPTASEVEKLRLMLSTFQDGAILSERSL